MTDLSYELIKSLVSEGVFERGEAYFYSQNVNNLKFDSHKYSAKVIGTEDYRVSVWEENGKWVGTCTCPYDWEDYCKHIVAVMLCILDSQGKFREKQRTKTPSSIKKVKPLTKIINNLSSEDLQQAVYNLVKVNPEIEDQLRILAQSTSQDLGQKSITEYKKIIRSTTPSFIDYYHTVEALVGAQEVEKLARLFSQKHIYSEAAKIYQAVFEVLIKAIQCADDSDGYIGSEINFAFENWTDNIFKIKDLEVRQKYFDFVFNKFTNDDWQGNGFTNELLSIIIEKAVLAKDCQYLLQKVLTEYQDLPSTKSEIDSYQKSFLINCRLDLLAKIKQNDQYFKLCEANLHDPKITIKFVKKHIELKNFQKALEIGEQYLPKIWEAYQPELAQELLELYKHFKNQTKVKDTLLFLFLSTKEFSYYDELKSVCQKSHDWLNYQEKIIQSLKKSDYSNILIDLYFKEKMIKQILTLAHQSENEYDLDRIAKGLASILPKDSFWVYQKFIKVFLKSHVGRNYYRQACRSLRQMRKLGFEQKFKGFINELRQTYYNRPAFLEELQKLC